MEYKEFIDNLKGVTNNRLHKIKNSWGVYDAYKFYRKNKPKNKKFVLTDSQYYSIIRGVNEMLSEALVKGEDINLPERMGRIELRKYKLEPRLDSEGRLVYKAPIDWDATLKLWYDDPKEQANKTLIKIEANESYRVIYNKSKASFNNKSFYALHINRELKKKIFKASESKTFDAFTFKKQQ